MMLSPRQMHVLFVSILFRDIDIDCSVWKFTVSEPMQPKGVKTFTVYVIEMVVSGNVTNGLGLYGSLKNVLGVHSYRNESVGSAMTVGVR